MTVFNPIQFYFVPIRESDLVKPGTGVANEGDFEIISSASSTDDSDVRSLVSVAIAAEATIIIYDHWEDGLELDISAPTQSTTLIFGDGDLSNNGGLTPAGANDFFSGGESFVLSSLVDVNRTTSDIFFDGGDQIAATFPIAVTRAAFPTATGSVIAGATEALDIDNYGDSFVVPVGPNMLDTDITNAFEYTAAHVMASGDNTDVFVNGILMGTIDAGESYVVRDLGARLLHSGDTITTYDPNTATSGKGVQVHLVTGDIDSNYETRWYSLNPRDQWASEYWTPTFTGENSADQDGGSGLGPTQVWLYNPNDAAITVQVDFRGTAQDTFVNVPAGDAVLSPIIPNDSGGRFYSVDGDAFFALSQTDTTGNGLYNDWGAPLVAADQLTSQVTIALGYGNTPQLGTPPGNSGDNRSVVWVTPTEDARFYIDYNGDGSAEDTFVLDRLQSARVIDPNDNDMSGTIIWAVDAATESEPVDIAVSYGQDPQTPAAESNSLDLGTVIPPLPELESAKNVRLTQDADANGGYSPGDTVTYTITVANSGRVDIAAGGYIVNDLSIPIFDSAVEGDSGGPLTYVAGSATIDFAPYSGGNIVALADLPGSNPFPLSSSGWLSTRAINSGDVHLLTFEAKIKDFEDLAPGTTSFTNEGALLDNTLGVVDEFSVTRELVFDPSINIEKYTNGVDVTTGTGPQLAVGAAVTWTYVITNTGDTALANVAVEDDQEGSVTTFLGGDTDNDGLLDLGETWTYQKTGTAQAGQYENSGSVSADAAFADTVRGNPILIPTGNGGGEVTDADTSKYFGIETGSIAGTVFQDTDANGQEDGIGLQGQTVELLGSDGSVLETAATDANGDYLFDDLSPGQYAVRFTQPSNFGGVSPQDQGNDATDSDGNSTTLTTDPITLTAGALVTNIDQGFFDDSPAVIGNRVWDDLDKDGRQERGEPGLAGVTVSLLDQNGDPILDAGTPVTTVTNANGFYKFKVSPGTYIVEFDAPNMRVFTEFQSTVNPVRDSDADTTTGRSDPITVTWGDVRRDIDAGLTFKQCTDIEDAFVFPSKSEATIILNNANPHQNGTNGADIIWGRGAADTISTNGGKNVVVARGGDDIVNGGNKKDLIAGNRGDDILNGNGGHDSLSGGRGHDKLYGGSGNDLILAGQGADLVEGGAGRDRINLGAGNDTAQGEGGNDCIAGGTDSGRIRMKHGELTMTRMGDELFGNGGKDTFEYNSGDGVDFLFDFKPSDGDKLKLYRVDPVDVDFIRVQTKYGPAAGLGIDANNGGVYEGAIVFHQTQNPDDMQDWIDDGSIMFLL